MQRNCGIPACGASLAKGEVSAGLRLCGSCRHSLAGQLSKLPDLYAASEHVLEGSRHHPIRSLRRGRWQTGICLDEVAFSVRSDTVRVLSSWCNLVIDERAAAGPGGMEVSQLTAFLRTHLRWLAAHAAAADFAMEIGDVVADITEIFIPAQVRMIDLGLCASEGCGQTVRARVDRSAVTQVGCDAGHIWKPQQWLRLRQQRDQSGLAIARQVHR